MKRAGFTMIELIFVIVILGILAAVALPKFIGVSEQAEAGKCKAFYATLSRTVEPAIWSNMLLNDINATEAFKPEAFSSQIDIIKECELSSDSSEDSWSKIIAVALEGEGFSVNVGDEIYDVNGTTATPNAAPMWKWQKRKKEL